MGRRGPIIAATATTAISERLPLRGKALGARALPLAPSATWMRVLLIDSLTH